MGCDIHMFAEKRNKKGEWEKISKAFDNEYYDPNRPSKVDEDGYEWNAKKTDHPYNGRNYNLFAILADVRNGRGFAGIKTGEGFVPIAEPRGLPTDVSSEIAAESESWGIDGHSHSYFTVKELLAYDWGQFTVLRGLVDWEHWKECKEKDEKFDNYCGDASGPNIVKIEESEAELYLEKGLPKNFDGKSVYVNAHWPILYSESAELFFKKTIPSLQRLGADEDIRIVFFFDN